MQTTPGLRGPEGCEDRDCGRYGTRLGKPGLLMERLGKPGLLMEMLGKPGLLMG